MGLWSLAGSKFVGQACSLKIQVRFDVALLSPISAGQASRPEAQAGFLDRDFKGEFLLLWETCFCFYDLQLIR